MLPLDYPPCWEFPLRKKKMHPHGYAKNGQHHREKTPQYRDSIRALGGQTTTSVAFFEYLKP